MGEQNGTHMVRGVVAGIAGGLLASWVMNVFMEQAGPKITEAVETVSGDKPEPARKKRKNQSTQNQDANDPNPKDQEPKQDATMKAADAIVSTVTGGRHLSFEERQKGGPVVHYAFGALMGGLYGAVAEYAPSARTGFGTGFGSALFAGADLVAVPALHLSARRAMLPQALWQRPSPHTWCTVRLLKACAGWCGQCYKSFSGEVCAVVRAGADGAPTARAQVPGSN